MSQLGLFDVLSVYEDDPLSNHDLYGRLQDAFGLSDSDFEARVVVDRNGNKASELKRRTRWHQQTLKYSGLLQRTGPGQWCRTGKKREFTQLIGSQVMLGYSTDLGCALWGDIRATAELIEEPIQLYFSSPPYPLAVGRSYGNVPVEEYVDWLCDALAPVISRLAPSGAMALNLSNDIFAPRSPRRPSYLARLTISLEDRFNLFLMDTIPWISNKAPGPMQWAQRKPVQLFTRWEPILWFAPDPEAVSTDNRRIECEGLPGNVWEISNTCVANRELRRKCQSLGLPVHDAMYPLALARRAVEFWTTPGQLVVDLMSGSNTLGYAAEELGRRWIVGDQNAQFVAGGALRWPAHRNGLHVNPGLLRACS